ncbi:MAG: alanine racemase [Clostridiales bacterium]|jgi:D-serine deaminase-like pyridoxal phosphate-dependent protein|nr:alanine racemase [Clostridiales bacterium]
MDFDSLQTPCLVIDERIATSNIKRMQEAADASGCRLRPHIKTHKTVRFALAQVAAGAIGITCAKVSEAEVMADGGLDDIFIAYPIIGKARTKRVIELSRRVKRLILSVDSLEGALALSAYASEAGVSLEVRLEVDTGAGRTGVALGDTARLAVQISELGNLRLTGIYSFKGLRLQGLPTLDRQLAAEEEGAIMASAAQAIRGAGVSITDVSAGSTPTGIPVAQTGKVNEIRPGTYIYNDQMMVDEGAAKFEEIAARIYVTVVSANKKDLAVVDGGSKTFPADTPLGSKPLCYDTYAFADGVFRNGKEAQVSGLKLDRMNEEHGIITSRNGETGLAVGDVIRLIPVHVCTAVNMQNEVLILSDSGLEVQKVDARGMLQ